MSAVSETVVREYFEMLGFLVTQPRKYMVPGRPKTPDEEVDLIVSNPRCPGHVIAPEMVWGATEVKGIARAVVGVRGWHSERFYASTFEQTPDILRFAQEESVQFASSIVGPGPIAKILCLPKLPASEDLKAKVVTALRESGIDGVLSFRTVLADLVSWIDSNRNYEKSDLLQTIRMLKNYDLIKDPQLELFDPTRSRRRR